MRSAIDASREINAELYRPMHLGLLATVYGSLNEREVSLALFDEACATVEKTEERLFEAELHRLRGELLLASGEKSDAEKSMARALEIARRQQARMWELRAAVSLARLRRDQGRRAEARDLLAPVYGWFTEGFDTADLKDAKALLEELR
jgi:predicted ATPase